MASMKFPLWLSPFLAVPLLLFACGKSTAPTPAEPSFGSWLVGNWQDVNDLQYKIRVEPNQYQEEALFRVPARADELVTTDMRCRYRHSGAVSIEAPNEQDLTDARGKLTPDHVIVMRVVHRELLDDARNGEGCKAFLERADRNSRTNVILLKKTSDTEFTDVMDNAIYRKL